MYKKYISWTLIVIGSIMFLLLPLIFSHHPPEETNFLFSPPTFRDILSNGLMICFFFANYFFFIDVFYLKKRYVTYGLIVIICIAIIAFLPSLCLGRFSLNDMPPPPHSSHDLLLNMPPQKPDDNFFNEIKHNFLLFFVVLIFSIFIKVQQKLFALEISKAHSDLAMLNLQINPHFLFNALNSIYVMNIKENAPQSSASTMKLANIMRYIELGTHKKWVELKQEVQFIIDFVEFHKLRFEKSVEVIFNVSPILSDKRIAPFLLIPFIENAFKYGIDSSQKSVIEITILLVENDLFFEIKNEKRNTNSTESTKIGIKNTKQRLQLLYPHQHELKIVDEEKFMVNLKINLNDESNSNR